MFGIVVDVVELNEEVRLMDLVLLCGRSSTGGFRLPSGARVGVACDIVQMVLSFILSKMREDLIVGRLFVIASDVLVFSLWIGILVVDIGY